MTSAQDIINALNLEPLEGEGGYFRQTWILPSDSGSPIGTAILYLITPDSYSSLHRLDADEIFHFYLGDPCEQIIITPNGKMQTRILGSDILNDQQVQSIVPEACWQGTRLKAGGAWALLGTTMAPGFHAGGFDLAETADLSDMPEDIACEAATYLATGHNTV